MFIIDIVSTVPISEISDAIMADSAGGASQEYMMWLK